MCSHLNIHAIIIKNIALIQLSILAFGLSSLPDDGSELATMKARVKELEAEVANYKKCMPFSDEKRSNGTSKVLINYNYYINSNNVHNVSIVILKV